mgnify:CR=1 FL=1
MNIGPYRITNSSAGAHQSSMTRVYLDGVIIAEVRMGTKSNPLKWIRTRPLSGERAQFVNQLRANGVPDEDVKAILAVPKKS